MGMISCSGMASVGSILGDRWGITGQATVLASAAAIAATLVVVRFCLTFVALLGDCCFVESLWLNTVSLGRQIALNSFGRRLGRTRACLKGV